MSQDSEKGIGLDSVISNASKHATLARHTRHIGLTIATVGMIVTLVHPGGAWMGAEGLIGLSFVFMGAGMVVVSGHGARRASKNLYAAIEHLEMRHWLDDYGDMNLEAMLDDLRQKKGMEIRDGGAAYFLQRGHGSMRVAEGKGGADEWRHGKERIDAMVPRPEIEAAEISPRPAEKIVEEANAKRAEEANEAFLRSEKNDGDLIEAGVGRLDDDLGGPLTSSERP